MLLELLGPRREMTPSKMETPKGPTPSPSPCAKVAGLVVAGAGHTTHVQQTWTHDLLILFFQPSFSECESRIFNDILGMGQNYRPQTRDVGRFYLLIIAITCFHHPIGVAVAAARMPRLQRLPSWLPWRAP